MRAPRAPVHEWSAAVAPLAALEAAARVAAPCAREDGARVCGIDDGPRLLDLARTTLAALAPLLLLAGDDAGALRHGLMSLRDDISAAAAARARAND